MNPPSLLHLSMLPLSTEQTIEICSSDQFPSCDEIWKAKAQLDFGISPEFFDLFLGLSKSSKRSINNFQRYLELSSVNSFLPQVSEDLIEAFAGVRDAVLKGDEEQLDFFFSRLGPEAKSELTEIVSSSSKLDSFFPQGADLVSFPVLDKLVNQLTGHSLKETSGKISPAQLWLIKEKIRGPLEVKIRIQMAYCEAIPHRELIEDWDSFPPDVLCYLIERGNEQALEKVLSFTRQGRFGFTFEGVFLSILKSGRMDFVEAFRPYFQYLNSLTDKPSKKLVPTFHYYFAEAFYGGNSKIIEFLSENGKITLAKKQKPQGTGFVSDYLRNILEGFFFHRNVEASCQTIEQIPELKFVRSFDSINFSSVPIDILDCIYRVVSQSSYFSPRNFFTKVLLHNLGYLNVVNFCLEKLKELDGKELTLLSEDPIFQETLDKYSDLTPISVSAVCSALKF